MRNQCSEGPTNLLWQPRPSPLAGFGEDEGVSSLAKNGDNEVPATFTKLPPQPQEVGAETADRAEAMAE